MGNSIGWPADLELSDFQRRKLLHDYYTFYDINKDGHLDVHDFELARKKICKINGWEEGGENDRQSEELFREIWHSLKVDADENKDDKVSAGEWLRMWEDFHRAYTDDDADKLPSWLNKYLEYRFHVYDTSGDGIIDANEFEYCLTKFGVPVKDVRKAWEKFTLKGQKKVDYEYFCHLAVEYYRSDDPEALGNYLTGRLNFDKIEFPKVKKSKTKEKTRKSDENDDFPTVTCW